VSESNDGPTGAGEHMALRIMAVLRLAFAALGAYTLAYAANQAATPPGGAGLVKFFSYFTVLSNCAATVVLAAGGVALLLDRRGVPGAVRGAVVVYMTVTGIIYAVVLQADAEGQLQQWIDSVLHQLMPAFVFVDWLAVPPRRRVTSSALPYWLVFPVVFATYSLIRGPIAQWYPYPFLDPRTDGYGHVAAQCFVIALAIVAVCMLIVWIGDLARRTAPERYRRL
jgi:hypothetical protein